MIKEVTERRYWIWIPILVLAALLTSCAQQEDAPAPTEESAPTTAALPTPTATAPIELPEGSPFLVGDLNTINFLMEKKVDAVPLAGVTLGIRWGEGPAYIKGYGLADIPANVPADEETVYRIASLTKQFTAASVLKLVDRGMIDLDDAVIDLLPNVPESWANITVHHLLSHTSGIPDLAVDLNLIRAIPKTMDELVSILADHGLGFEPGSQFKYTSSGYFLLCGIIKQMTGSTCSGFFQEEIFDPLGMDFTFDCLQEFEGIAQGYQIEEHTLVPVLHSPTHLLGSFGLCSTAGDLLIWQQALAQGRVISTSAYEQMTSPTILTDGTTIPYGYGLGIGVGTIAHGGVGAGFQSYLVSYPAEDLTLVLLANTMMPSGYSLDITAKVIAERLLGE